jgi:hypothetical protein
MQLRWSLQCCVDDYAGSKTSRGRRRDRRGRLLCILIFVLRGRNKQEQDTSWRGIEHLCAVAQPADSKVAHCRPENVRGEFSTARQLQALRASSFYACLRLADRRMRPFRARAVTQHQDAKASHEPRCRARVPSSASRGQGEDEASSGRGRRGSLQHLQGLRGAHC